MIGMVLVTHGRLATEFVAALEHVVGEQEQVASVCIGPDDDMEQRRLDILNSVAEVDDGSGVVLLTDMFGGTPSNLAISIMDKAKVEVIAGVNLPMLIKLASVRQTEKLANAVLAVDLRSSSDFVMTGVAAMLSLVHRHHLQPARTACAGRRQVRQAGRQVRRGGRGRAERHGGVRSVDHGADDACGQPRLQR